MAISDLLLKDQSPTPAPFAPESTDQGTNAAGTTIKRTMVGLNDGADITRGAKADAAWDGAASAPSEMSVFKSLWSRLGAVGLAAGNALIGKVGIDQTTPGTSNRVSIGSDGQVQENVLLASNGFSRPANTTAYAAGNIIAASTAAGQNGTSVAVARANNQSGALLYAKLDVSNTAWLNATVRAHFFAVNPTLTVGDGGAAAPPLCPAPRAGYLGAIDIVLDRSFNDGVAGVAAPSPVPELDFTPVAGSQNVVVVLQTLTALTPGSGDTFTITLAAR